MKFYFKTLTNGRVAKCVYLITALSESFGMKFGFKKLTNNKTAQAVVFIDKDRNIRGRKSKNKKGKAEYFESYNTTSAAELHNQMTDDVKILLREYRLALKKNDPNRRKNATEIDSINQIKTIKNEK